MNTVQISHDFSILDTQNAEVGLLGTVLMMGQMISKILFLRPEHFSHPAYGEVWRHCLDIHHHDGVPSVMTVGPRIGAAAGNEASQMLAFLAGNAGLPMNLEHYAEHIRDFAIRRQVISFAKASIEQAFQVEKPSDEVIAGIINRYTEISVEGSNRGVVKRQVLEDVVNALNAPQTCYSTGLKGLDEATGGGFYAGKLYGFDARKKTGKTFLLGGFSKHMNDTGVDHLFIPLEMSPEEIEYRHVATDMGFNSIKFLTRDMPDLAHKVAQYCANTLDHTVYEYQPGATLDEIRAMVSRAIVKHKIKGVILDYWQMVEGRQRSETEEYHLRMVAQTLANICKREKLFVVTAAQVNQEGNTRGGEGLKNSCDQYYSLHRDKEDQAAWLEMKESRYTIYQNVGSDTSPGLWLDKVGPHFRDFDMFSSQVDAAEG